MTSTLADKNIFAAFVTENLDHQYSVDGIVFRPDGRVERIAQSPDCTSVDGGPDQPGEPSVWDRRLIVSCFDLVTGLDKVNRKQEMPATLVDLAL